MTGDVVDFVWRQLTVLPGRWFGNNTPAGAQPPLLSAVLTGFATAWSAMYQLLMQVQLMARIRTATGAFLDMIASDFFGAVLSRRPDETDPSFLQRILQELLRPRATRAALVRILTETTGNPPIIFEPARPEDTGGYTVGGVGYCVGGGWGNLDLHYTSFVTAFRPAGAGIAFLAGYGSGGYLYYGDLDMVQTPVTDSMIYAACAAVMPSGYVAWMRLRNS